MPRYATNVSTRFCNVPFLDRFDTAAGAGFEAVELQWPTVDQLAGRTLQGRPLVDVQTLGFDAEGRHHLKVGAAHPTPVGGSWRSPTSAM